MKECDNRLMVDQLSCKVNVHLALLRIESYSSLTLMLSFDAVIKDKKGFERITSMAQVRCKYAIIRGN